MLAKLKALISSTRDQAKTAGDDLAAVEKAYAEASAEIEGLNGRKMALDAALDRAERRVDGENPDVRARRVREASSKVKEVFLQIAAAASRQADLGVERQRLRAERDKAARTADLAQSESGAEAISALEAAKKVVEDLEAKREAAARHTNKLAEERAAISLQAHTGDDAARLRLDALHIEIGLQTSEAASLEAALNEARQRVRNAETTVEHQQSIRRASEVSRISGLIRTESEAFDAAAGAMVAALRRRADLIRDLAKNGVDSGIRNHLVAPMAINRALARAGLGQFADFDRGGNAGHQRTLSDHDAAHIGGESSATTTPRAA